MQSGRLSRLDRKTRFAPLIAPIIRGGSLGAGRQPKPLSGKFVLFLSILLYLPVTIRLLAVGKIKKSYLKDGVADYTGRIRRHCKFEIIEIPEGGAIEPQQNEGKLLLKKLDEKPSKATYSIALIEGKPIYDSQALAARLKSLQNQGVSHLTFVIGGSHGLSQAILKRANMQLSFSPLTFPHQFFRLILCEQIYRCLKINSGQIYQK